MADFVLSPDADEDVYQIWRYLFERAGMEIADHVENRLYSTFEKLAQMPGQDTDDLTNAEVLLFAVYRYMIVYRVRSPLEIVRVLHGRRNLEKILKVSE